MYRLKSVNKCTLTNELAHEFANMKPLPGERNLDPGHVEKLRALTTRKLFRDGTWDSAVIGEIRYRANGQHSSVMLSNLAEEEFPAQVSVVITEWELTDLNDAPALFDRFDPRACVRTIPDIVTNRVAG